jgi:hypothetical protein
MAMPKSVNKTTNESAHSHNFRSDATSIEVKNDIAPATGELHFSKDI